jgi:hypothetical protein
MFSNFNHSSSTRMLRKKKKFDLKNGFLVRHIGQKINKNFILYSVIKIKWKININKSHSSLFLSNIVFSSKNVKNPNMKICCYCLLIGAFTNFCTFFGNLLFFLFFSFINVRWTEMLRRKKCIFASLSVCFFIKKIYDTMLLN